MRYETDLVFTYYATDPADADRIAAEMVAMLERRFHKQETSGFIDKLYPMD